MAKASTAVAARNENQVAAFSADVPDYLKGQTGAGRGNEGVGQDDMVIPRLEIVQSQSPIKDQDENAKEGFLFNTATNEVLGDTAYFIPIFFRKEWIVWKDKEEGGGYFGSFATEGEAKDRRTEKIEDGENEDFLEIVDTPVHFGLLVSPSGAFAPQQIAISMAKSKAKVSRKWNSVIQLCGGDRFSRVYKLTTFKDKNNKNQTFYNFVVQPAGFPPETLYQLALDTYTAMQGKQFKAQHDIPAHDEGQEERAGRGDI